MRKIKYILLTLIIILFIINIDIVIDSCKTSLVLFINKVFVCVFPFVILSDILLYYDYHIFLQRVFGKYISKLFNIDPSVSIIFILSIFTASPTNSIYIKDMLDNKQIDTYTAQRILSFTYFSSIPFVIGTIGITLFKSFKIGLILYILMLIHNVMIGILLRNDNTSYNPNKMAIIKDKNIFVVLKKSILKAIESSLIILGNLIIFTIVTNIILKYINLSDITTSILCGLLEITNGIVKVSNLNINIIYKVLLTSFLLNFSSLSILFQSFSILNNYNINIKKILMIRLVFSIISLIEAFITITYIIMPIL